MANIRRTYPDRTVNLDPDNYKVAWIAPLEIEAKAALYLLDERHHGRFSVGPGDDYVLQAGAMGGHNVVIATLPAGQEYGTGSAAALASTVKRLFPNLWFGLLVGVAAGLPDLFRGRDIRLGDILVGLPEGESAGLIAYDLGKETEDGFQLLRSGHSLAMTEPIVRSAIGSIKFEAPNESDIFLPYYEKIAYCEHAMGTFVDPGQDTDILYDDQDETIHRSKRSSHQRTRVWYGPIGSGDKLLKSAERRDELRDKYGIIGLEMEAAGTMNRIPVGVIRGVCDYGDQHKNKDWQPYAAAMAASYARALLDVIPSASQSDSRSATAKQMEDIAKVPASCYYIPLAKNPRFTGRADIIKELYEKLFGEQQVERMALVGLGGVGKTQIALHFAYHIKESHPEYSIFCVPTLSHESTERAYMEIAKKLGLEESSDEDVKEQVCQHLSSDEAGKWLLIVDNADDEKLIQGSEDEPGLEELFPQSEHGRILLTTRSGRVALDFAQPDVIDVEQLDQQEAINLFKGSLTQKKLLQNEELVVELLTRLTFLPLAITQAAAYLNQTRAPLQSYLKLLKGAETDLGKALGREFRDNTRYKGSRNAIGTTWIVSFEQIQQSDPLASDLLSFISFIEPKAIPQYILPGAEPEELEWAIGVLCNYSFLTRREDSEVFDMHNLVHAATRGWLEKKNQDTQVLNNAIIHIAKIFPWPNGSQFSSRREYVPHAMRLLDRNHEKTEDTYLLFDKIGRALRKDRRYAESLRCFEEVRSWQQKNLPETDSLRLSTEWFLADGYVQCQRSKDAIGILEHVVETQAQILAVDDHDQLSAQTTLGIAYLKEGQHKKAIEMLQEVMEVQKDLDESNRERLLDRLLTEHCLALAYINEGRSEGAIELLKHVIATRKNVLGEKHRETVVSQGLLASVYIDKGRPQDAIEMLENVVAVEQDILDDTDDSRLLSVERLAKAYLKVGRTQEGTRLFEYVLAVKKRIMDERDTSRLDTAHSLGIAYLAAGRTKDAIEILELLAATEEEALDEKDRNRMTTLHDLARAYLQDERIREAFNIFEHVGAVGAETLPEDDDQRKCSEEALRICKEILDEAHGSDDTDDSEEAGALLE
ncbi:kinesin light chain [Fusarium austroafricanum]|uniref:Kinesin light chain n=1 Tax=Fusarium austroafricanum TaxID=2364996 RepID=A0A8H4KUV3_9HYPO|nr:kinesin light chain [Fusarium austroafricanum]